MRLHAPVLLSLVLSTACTGDTACPEGLSPTRDGDCVDASTGADGGDDGSTDSGTTGGDDGGTDSGASSGLEGFTVGHPMETLGSVEDGFYEWVDAEVFSESYGVVTGQGGVAVVDMATGTPVAHENADRGYYLSVVGDVAWVGTKYRGAYRMDLSDPTEPRQRQGPAHAEDEAHHDLAYDGDVVVMSFLSGGLRIWEDAPFADGTGNRDTPPVASYGMAAARALQFAGEDRLLVTDEVDGQPQLVLLDVADWTAPAELDRVDLDGLGHDLAFEDGVFEAGQVAVALGGSGVQVFSLAGDTLTDRGRLTMPGTATGVDIDGGYLWVGAWEATVLAWLGDGGPVVLGHEPPTESAMGIGAGFGRALVADWFHSTAVALVPETAGPELVVEDTIYFPDDDGASQRVEVWNNGAFPLDVSLSDPDEYDLSETAFTLDPGARQTVIATARGRPVTARVSVTSNDPDEADASIELSKAPFGIGTEHPDFELLGLTWPDTELRPYRLTDFEGEVVFLAYWAEY